jgi:NAD(P)-dependent dehydrogenase (short-subunit alcohol dehydrogenase family)
MAGRQAATAVAEFGRLDGAFNNAGGVTAAGPVPGFADAAWHAEREHNLTSVSYCLRAQIPVIARIAGRGSIVNNASPGGLRGIPGMSAYLAAKHGVAGLAWAAGAGGRTAWPAGQRAGHRERGHTAVPPAAGAQPHRPGGQPGRDRGVRGLPASEESAFIAGAARAIDGGSAAG